MSAIAWTPTKDGAKPQPHDWYVSLTLISVMDFNTHEKGLARRLTAGYRHDD